MKKKALIFRNFFVLGTAFFLTFTTGCKNAPTEPAMAGSTTDNQAMLKLVESDSAVSSFQPNYNEGNAMAILTGSLGINVYPIKVGQKLRLVSKNFTYTEKGDTAFGKYTQTFEGVLFVKGTANQDSTQADSVVQKPFTTVITRNIIFVRVGNTNRPKLNWSIAAVSLPMGGTMNSNVNITKLTVYLTNGDTIEVNNPNDYFLSRGHGKWKQIPRFNEGKPVTIQVQINSAYADTDFVTLTHGADFQGFNREKVKFNLISATATGNGYTKIYQKTFSTEHSPGYFHAVINAYSRQEIYDNTSPVEISSWGVPYYIK